MQYEEEKSMFTTLLESAPVTTFADTPVISANWTDPITSFITANAPVIIIGFVTLLGLSAGIAWAMRTAKKAVKV